MMLHQMLEKRVITKPLALGVQRDDKQIAISQQLDEAATNKFGAIALHTYRIT